MALPQPLTLTEFLRLPETKPALEFVHGRVIQKVSPKLRHSGVQTRLPTQINQFAEPRTLALAFVELRATFGGVSVVPDVAVYAWDRVPVDARGELIDDVFDPPDIAFEIRSPGQRLAELRDRCAWYVANGVRAAVLIDPGRRLVMLFLPDVPPRTLQLDEALEFPDVLPGFRLEVREIFGWLRPKG